MSCGDQTVRIRDPETWTEVTTPQFSRTTRLCLAYSPDGERIFASHENGDLELLDANTGEERHSWSAHNSSVRSVAYSTNGQWIASSSDDLTVKLWNAKNPRFPLTFSGHSMTVLCVKLSPDNLQAVSCGKDGTVRRWYVYSDKATAPEIENITGVAFSQDGRHVAICTEKGMVREWDSQTGASSLVLVQHFGRFFSISYSPTNSDEIVTCGMDKFVVSYDSNSGEHIEPWFDRHQHSPIDLQRKCLPRIKTWNRETGATISTFSGHAIREHNDIDIIYHVAYSPCGRWIVSCGTDTTVRLWDTRDGTPGHVFIGHKSDVYHVAFSPTGHQFASGSRDGTIRLWDPPAGGESIAIFKGKERHGVSILAYSPCGQVLAVGYIEHYLRILETSTGLPLAHLSGYDNTISDVAFSSCGRWLASSSWDKTVRFWRVPLNEGLHSTLTLTAAAMEWSCAYILRDFFGSVHRLAWKPLKSLEFVTVSNDNSVRMWRLAEDEQGIVRVSQVWGTRTGGIVASGAIIRDVVGLSKINQDLLIQRGATDGMTNESNISDSVGDSMEGDTSE